jgi:hypothetical protein
LKNLTQSYKWKLDRETSSSKEDFVGHYRTKYTSEKHLSIWMATELLTLGTISKMVTELPKRLRKQMGRDYALSQSQLVSWLHCVAYVRNVCAHHGRLWNRELSLKPELLKEWDVSSADSGRMYVVSLMLRHFIEHIAPNFQWKEGLIHLMSQYPGVSRPAMRFATDRADNGSNRTARCTQMQIRIPADFSFPGFTRLRGLGGVCSFDYRHNEPVAQALVRDELLFQHKYARIEGKFPIAPNNVADTVATTRLDGLVCKCDRLE